MNEDYFCEKLRNPLVVFWELTQCCNLKCRHCYTHSEKSGFQLSAKEMCHILSELIDREIFSLGLGGGEPLMVQELDFIIKTARRNDIDVSLSTNGTLVTLDWAKKLKDLGVSVAQVSVDGLELTHDYIRGCGSFKKAIRAVENLKKAGLVVRLAFTVNRINFIELESVFHLSQVLGVDWFIVFRYMDSGREGSLISLEKNQLKLVTQELINLQKKFPTKVFYEKLVFFPFLFEDGLKSGKTCNAGKSIMNICANGDITPCPHVRDFVVGNILVDEFAQIWKNPAIEMAMQKEASCAACVHVDFCEGGCKGTFTSEIHRDYLCWKEI